MIAHPATRGSSPYISPVHDRQSVTLKGMRFHTLIGILPHEQTVAQPVEIDLTVWRVRQGSPPPMDYRQLYAIAAGGFGKGHAPYLEDVADRVAAAALAMDGVEGVRVAVRKPHVALPGPLDHAEVVVERTRK
jgi:dihydroneopterin aldolase